MNKDITHTPGPWELQDYTSHNGYACYRIRQPGAQVCIGSWTQQHGDVTKDRNAALVIAAPRLLAGLKICVRALLAKDLPLNEIEDALNEGQAAIQAAENLGGER